MKKGQNPASPNFPDLINLYMNIIKSAAALVIVFCCFLFTALSQQNTLEFGTVVTLNSINAGTAREHSLKWVNVNTDEKTFSVKDNMLVCTGLPIGVMRSEKKYENFI